MACSDKYSIFYRHYRSRWHVVISILYSIDTRSRWHVGLYGRSRWHVGRDGRSRYREKQCGQCRKILPYIGISTKESVTGYSNTGAQYLTLDNEG